AAERRKVFSSHSMGLATPSMWTICGPVFFLPNSLPNMSLPIGRDPTGPMSGYVTGAGRPRVKVSAKPAPDYRNRSGDLSRKGGNRWINGLKAQLGGRSRAAGKKEPYSKTVYGIGGLFRGIRSRLDQAAFENDEQGAGDGQGIADKAELMLFATVFQNVGQKMLGIAARAGAKFLDQVAIDSPDANQQA